MANIGTLIQFLWFLGLSFTSYACSNTCSVFTLNELAIDSDTFVSVDFVNSKVKIIPEGVRKIVIDAGHGGHDHGCSGKLSNEKNVTLEIALKLGASIKEQYPEIEVLYTRTKDVFVPLHKRIDLANKNDADLFLSIHANAFSDHMVSGTEVFVMGLHTAEENLRVAKRENASVLLESDFEKNYDGYDPNSPEAQIILSMYQNAFLDKSILLAQKITDAIAGKTDFINRGVKQAGFVILRKAAMPSVLIETGFLSNESDEALLHTAEGQQLVADAIAGAIGEYKFQAEKESEHMIALQEKTRLAIEEKNHGIEDEPIVYRVQLGAFSLDKPRQLPGFIAGEPIDVVLESGMKKLIAGKFKSYEQAAIFQQRVRGESTYNQAFIVAYRGGRRIGIDEASALLSKGS